MKVLLIGGAREHAIASKLSQSSLLTKLYTTSENPGILSLAEKTPCSEKDFPALISFCKQKEVDFTIVGPEQPLVDGIVDRFQKEGLQILGPNQKGAQLEGSKTFAKAFMQRNQIPTAKGVTFQDYPQSKSYLEERKTSVVLKADGLAAGKGVAVCHTHKDALHFLESVMIQKTFGDSGNKIVIEEFLSGQEMSIMVLVSGKNYAFFPPAQDHKPVFDQDQGPNTGGMGAYSPTHHLLQYIEIIEEKIILPTVLGLHQENFNYHGVLYISLIVSPKRIDVIEYNVRFGDPEAQVLIPNLEKDLLDLLFRTATGKLENKEEIYLRKAGVCVVLASGGYPGNFEKGFPIEGILEHRNSLGDGYIFQAGTKQNKDQILTNGGRVLTCCGYADNLRMAQQNAYALVDKIHFQNQHFRKDIAKKALF